jgi:hypothetical protein
VKSEELTKPWRSYTILDKEREVREEMTGHMDI